LLHVTMLRGRPLLLFLSSALPYSRAGRSTQDAPRKACCVSRGKGQGQSCRRRSESCRRRRRRHINYCAHKDANPKFAEAARGWDTHSPQPSTIRCASQGPAQGSAKHYGRWCIGCCRPARCRVRGVAVASGTRLPAAHSQTCSPRLATICCAMQSGAGGRCPGL
jgi:hypothetical protein